MTNTFEDIFWTEKPEDDYDQVTSKKHKELLSKIMQLLGSTTSKRLNKRLLSPESLYELIDEKRTISKLVPHEINMINGNYTKLYTKKYYTKSGIDSILKIDLNVIDELDEKASIILLNGIKIAILLVLRDVNDIVEDIKDDDDRYYEIRAFKYKPRSIWWGKGAEDLMRKFYRQLRLYEWQNGGMFRITLEVDPERYDLIGANKIISKQFNVLMKELERGNKVLTIIRRQAIKEWNPDNSYPYLHLFIEIEKTRNSVKKIIQKYWTIGDTKTKKITSESEFHSALYDCILVESIQESLYNVKKKRARQLLPKEFRNYKYVSRVYYPQKNPSRALEFSEYKKFRKELALEGIELIKKLKKREEAEDAKKYVLKNKKAIDPAQKLNEKKPRKILTYQQRLEVDQSTISFKYYPSTDTKPIWLRLETPFRYLSRIYGTYYRDKAYAIKLTAEGLNKLLEIERLARVAKSLETKLKKRNISERDVEKNMKTYIFPDFDPSDFNFDIDWDALEKRNKKWSDTNIEELLRSFRNDDI